MFPRLEIAPIAIRISFMLFCRVRLRVIRSCEPLSQQDKNIKSHSMLYDTRACTIVQASDEG
jgi:hypothetical protein